MLTWLYSARCGPSGSTSEALPDHTVQTLLDHSHAITPYHSILTRFFYYYFQLNSDDVPATVVIIKSRGVCKGTQVCHCPQFIL